MTDRQRVALEHAARREAAAQARLEAALDRARRAVEEHRRRPAVAVSLPRQLTSADWS